MVGTPAPMISKIVAEASELYQMSPERSTAMPSGVAVMLGVMPMVLVSSAPAWEASKIDPPLLEAIQILLLPSMAMPLEDPSASVPPVGTPLVKGLPETTAPALVNSVS